MSDTPHPGLPPEIRDEAELAGDGILDDVGAPEKAEDIQDADELERERVEREERHEPELPDRAFDRIVPGV